MKITHRKLKKSIQRKQLEFFVAEVTARTVALFYHKIREVIDQHLSLEADDIFEGKVELDESYFGDPKGKCGCD